MMSPVDHKRLREMNVRPWRQVPKAANKGELRQVLSWFSAHCGAIAAAI
jgi:hypothetical protein